MDNAKLFSEIRTQLTREVAIAVEKVLGAFFADCDVTIQLRRHKVEFVDIRMREQMPKSTQT